jgi:RecB family exonuclease
MNFLPKVAAEIYAQHGKNLSHVHVVLPTHRACYFFRKALLEKGETMWLPKISTLSDWVEKNSGLQKIDPLTEIMQLHQLYLQLGKNDSLDEFIPLGRTLCSDFEEIDMHLVKPDWFFRELRNLAAMKVYEPATALTTSQLDYLKFWEQFEKLYTTLRSNLLAESKGNSGMMFRKVAENITDIAKPLNNFYIVGFDGLTKAEEVIVQHLHALNKATVYWDTDEYYIKNSEREAGYFFRKYFAEWKGNMKYCEKQITTIPKEIEIVSVARSVGQAKVAVEIITNKLKLSNENAINTALILPDEKLLQPLQYLLPNSLSKYNLTMGLPVSRSLAGEFFLLLFRLHESAERISHRSKKQKLYYKDLIAILQHPFSKSLFKNFNIQQGITDIRKKNIVFIDSAYFAKSYADFPSDVLAFLFHESNSENYLNQLANFAHQLIDNLKQIADNEIELEFLLKIADAVHTVAKTINHHSLLPKTIRILLTDEFKNHRVPFEGEPAEGLQIMGLMESRCLDFENVIVFSTNEGVIPSGRFSKSYIPHPLRNAAMFSHTQKDAKAAYLFYRLLHRAKRIFLLYDTEGNNLGGGEKSRFILQLQYELAKEAKEVSITESVYSVSPPQVSAPPHISVVKNESIFNKLKENLNYGLSPSALSSFVNCSLQYYFRYIAHLKEPDDVEENMESNTMGTAIHHVLEEIYKPLIGKEISLDWLEKTLQQTTRIEALLKEGFKDRFDDDALMQGKNHLQFRLSLKMIYSFLQNEIERIKAGEKISIVALESPLEASLKIGDEWLKIKGIADRIEWQNRTLTIVDFKSGKAKSAALKNEEENAIIEKPELRVQFQLLVYAWAYLKMHPETSLPIQSGIFWLQKTKNGFDNLSIGGNSLLSLQHIQSFENNLQLLLAKLLDKDLPFAQTEDIKRCEYCAYRRICNR